MRSIRLAILLLCASLFAFAAEDDAVRTVTLRAPLTTLIPVAGDCPDEILALEADLVVPADAPADLGLAAWVADDEGRWHQRFHPSPLPPGRHTLRIALDPSAAVHTEGHRGRWSPYRAARVQRCGLLLWSASGSRAEIVVERLDAIGAAATPAPTSGALHDLTIDGAQWGPNALRARTGQRIQLRLRPDPFPAEPCDPERFLLSAAITDPAGDERIYEGFFHEPQRLRDEGDREAASAAAPAAWALRYRPALPGTYHIQLRASWDGGDALTWNLPPLEVDGEIYDDYVRIDPDDRRFFVTGLGSGAPECWWPAAVNARSVWDVRGAARTGSRLSPDRRWHAYEAYLDRWHAAGIGAAEVWMASWNLALEWRDDWPDYPGLGRYSQVNAERMDRLLDRAYELGIRINLVINNHGQASGRADAEWQDNPYNAVIRGDGEPGPVAEPHEFFTDPSALAGQERLRRYIIARWADHPAIMGWKLWTEMNLTAGKREDLRSWHVQASERWHALDHYDHPVTSHWSGTYRTPDRAIVAQAGMDYVCIDAYHGRRGGRPGWLISDLFWHGLHNRSDNLAQFGKPIVITEYGGSAQAAPQPQLLAEHHQGHWSALMAGYATGPMLWWIEWMDQGPYYQPYTAVSRFVAGEDLRGADAKGVELIATPATGSAAELWCRAWTRPGRILGYLLDPIWGYEGEIADEHAGASITVGDAVAAGPMTIEWWDADGGEVVQRQLFDHPGGTLALNPPPFARHLAFKLWRVEEEDAGGSGE